jgi:hypothetical protein
VRFGGLMYLKKSSKDKLKEMSIKAYGIPSRWRHLIGQEYFVKEKEPDTGRNYKRAKYRNLKNIIKVMKHEIRKKVEKND